MGTSSRESRTQHLGEVHFIPVLLGVCPDRGDYRCSRPLPAGARFFQEIGEEVSVGVESGEFVMPMKGRVALVDQATFRVSTGLSRFSQPKMRAHASRILAGLRKPLSSPQ